METEKDIQKGMQFYNWYKFDKKNSGRMPFDRQIKEEKIAWDDADGATNNKRGTLNWIEVAQGSTSMIYDLYVYTI